MPSFSDSIFLFVLALLLFGPKKLPVLARELGKWVGEFRRASNEFKMQMEEELRLSEQEDRQKQIAAMEAAAPVAQPVEEPPHPHLPEAAAEVAAESAGEFATEGVEAEPGTEPAVEAGTEPAAEAVTEVLPIAISGELKMMPPSTGLPTARETREQSMEGSGDPLGGGLLDAIPSSSRHEDAAVALAAEGETRA